MQWMYRTVSNVILGAGLYECTKYYRYKNGQSLVSQFPRVGVTKDHTQCLKYGSEICTSQSTKLPFVVDTLLIMYFVCISTNR